MERPRTSTLAWGGIAGGVFLYDMFCPKGEQLSERFDDWMEHPRNKYIAMGATALVALHLTNLLPEHIDVLHQIGKIRR